MKPFKNTTKLGSNSLNVIAKKVVGSKEQLRAVRMKELDTAFLKQEYDLAKIVRKLKPATVKRTKHRN